MPHIAARVVRRIEDVQEAGMDVQLRLSPEVTVRIDAHAPDGTVCIRQYDGVDFEKMIHERQASSRLCLSKAQARTVASAIMGCAAEI